jgi:hypothetical protein
MQIAGHRRLWLLAGIMLLCGLSAVALAVARHDQWIEVPRNGLHENRVLQVLEDNGVSYQARHNFGVMYVRVPRSDWPRAVEVLDRDSLANQYPLNIKRITLWGTTVDVVRRPPFDER